MQEKRARVQSAQPKAKGEGKCSVEVALINHDGAPLKMRIEGKSVCINLVLLTNASRMEELWNLWNDLWVVGELSDEGQRMDRVWLTLERVGGNIFPKFADATA